ncbi:MAG: DUF6527 family protein [Chloroflexota bacterium]
MGRFRQRVIDWWRRRRVTRPRIDRITRYRELPDLPVNLDRHSLAVCGPDSALKWAAFECPCGRGHRIVVSLQSTHHPRWRLSAVDAGPSLWPSIDSHGESRCHFWLEDGRVCWVKDHERSGRSRDAPRDPLKSGRARRS